MKTSRKIFSVALMMLTMVAGTACAMPHGGLHHDKGFGPQRWEQSASGRHRHGMKAPHSQGGRMGFESHGRHTPQRYPMNNHGMRPHWGREE